ncbi:hypothetical protein JCGZ_14228 [Jatropha curcas]|uniref:Aluminum-activated malate transporter n=2 Tax=Jatropha curcas TaxID=180498 RepID=A0A067JX48_JATCU|nr:hypothetical protein JCGZ_14228 [Jatropha curcas]
MGKEASNKLEWRISVDDGTSEKLVAESDGPVVKKIWVWLKNLIILKVWKFLEKAWMMGVADPRKVIHGVKVGVALCVVSLLYYMRPLYEGVGGNAMWAVMTVVVVFENTAGATLSKSINRTIATFLAGSLGLGVNWIASQTGAKLQPVILGFSVFLFASAATFSRFIPIVKARFDYGAMIFILTFSLVSVSGYRVDELFDLAQHRFSTIVVGTSLCILISILICPIWAGGELHNLIIRNLEKLAHSLDGSMECYFASNSDEDPSKKTEGYRCVLNSKGTEDSMANFARWEPAHGRFNFRHPWKQYLNVGASLRSCAYCIETLNGCINTEIQAPEYLKKHLSDPCETLSSYASTVLKELANTVKTMTISSKIGLSITEMQFAAQELKNSVKSIPNHFAANPEGGKTEPTAKTSPPSVMDVLPLVTLVSLLLEIVTRVEDIVDAVNELARLADFKTVTTNGKANQNNPNNNQTMKNPPKV